MHGNPWAVLWDRKVLAFSAVYVLIATSFYAVSYWLPTIVRTFGVTPTINGLLNAVPWMIGAVLLVTLPRLAFRDQSVLRIVSILTLSGTLCFLASVLVADNTVRFLTIAIGGACITVLSPFFWTFPPRHFTGARAAAGIAAINSLGNLGGFFAQNLMPWMEAHTGSTSGAMLVPAVCLAALFVISLASAPLIRRQDAERSAQPSS